MTFAWVLNLDADLELAAPRGYAPRRSVLVAMRPHVATLAATLLAPDDVLVDAEAPSSATATSARGLPGRAYCPTPRAVALLRAAGAEPEPHPSVDVLRRVSSRAFASALGTTLPGAAFVVDVASARAMLATPPPIGDAWRIKRAFGMAGRGQRIVDQGRVDETVVAALGAGMAEGGVQIEPNVAIEREYAIHGLVTADGRSTIGAVVRQRCDVHGAWVATEALPGDAAAKGEIPEWVPGRLVEEAQAVARALFDAGYFGAFGVDAFTYRDRDGVLCLQPRSEINARYSMGFAVGMGGGGGASRP